MRRLGEGGGGQTDWTSNTSNKNETINLTHMQTVERDKEKMNLCRQGR